MATKTTTLTCAGFGLTSRYQCQELYNENNSSGIPDGYTATTPNVASTTRVFAFALPPDASNVSAVLTVTTGEGAHGSAVNTINGVSVDSETTVNINIPITASTTMLQIPFVYQCKKILHTNHGVEYYNHSSTMYYSNISLTITYDSEMSATSAIEKTGTSTVTYTDGDDNQVWLKGTGNVGQPWAFTVSGLPAGAIVTSATLKFACGNTTNKPGKNYVYWGNSQGGTELWSKSGSANGETYTVNLTSYVRGNGSYSLYFYKTANSSNSQSNVYFTSISVTVNYTYYVYSPTAPTNVTVSRCISTGDKVMLSWDASSGIGDNSVAGYSVYYADSQDCITWSDMVKYTDLSQGTSCIVSPPDVGYYRIYSVVGVGTISGSNSSEVESDRRLYHFGEEFTDEALISGKTYIKAVHMTELQNLAEVSCNCHKVAAPSFTDIIAGETSLAGWTSHVEEIRNAIDTPGRNHDMWIEINVNCPRADVIQQLRDVLLTL